MARVIDPVTGEDVRHCIVCGEDTLEEGTTCPNARDLCIEDCGEFH